MQDCSQDSSKDTLIAAVLNQRRLNSAQRQAAESSLSSLIDVLINYHIRYGAEFGGDLRTLASETRLNHKRVTKWMTRLIETQNLILISKGQWKLTLVKGKWKRATSIYSLGGALLIIATKLQGSLYQTRTQEYRSTYNSETILESCFDLVNDDYQLTCNEVAFAKSAPPTKLNRLLDDLPDIVDTEPYQYVPIKFEHDEKKYQQHLKTKRAQKLLANSQSGQMFVNDLWRQCQKEKSNGGLYQYPIHPVIYSILTDCDARLERFRRRNAELIANVHPDETLYAEDQIRQEYADDRINDICYDGERLRPEFRWLYQPPKETRKQCPRCKKDGRNITLRLTMLTSYRFGAIKLHCSRCSKVWDLWKEFPVWGK